MSIAKNQKNLKKNKENQNNDIFFNSSSKYNSSSEILNDSEKLYDFIVEKKAIFTIISSKIAILELNA